MSLSYLLPPPVASIIGLILLFLLLLKGRKHPERNTFALIISATILWGMLTYFMRASTDVEQALLWDQAIVPVIFSTFVFYYHFSLAVTGIQGKRVLIASYSILALAFVLQRTDFLVEYMEVKPYGYAPTVGIGVYILFLIGYPLFALAIYNLYRGYRASALYEERNRLLYLIIGMVFPVIGVTLDSFPIFYPMGIFGSIVFCIFASVAILKYHLLDIYIVIRKGTSYLLLSALIAIPYVAIIIGVSQGLGAQFPMWGYVLMLVVLAFALQPVWQRVQKRVDRLFYRERYDYLRALEQFGQQIKSITDLDSLAYSTLDIVSNAMQVRNACLMMPSPQTGDYRVVASRGLEGVSIQHKLERSSLLIRWMEDTSSFLKSREIEIIPQLQALSRNEREVLHDLKGELYISLKVLDKLVGIFILGQKHSQQLFIKEDLQLLSAVSSPLAISLENARLYQLERQRASEIAALQESLSRLTTELDMKLLLQKVTAEVAKLLQATAAIFFATEENSHSLVLKAAIGLTTSDSEEMKLALDSMIPHEFLDDFKQGNTVVTINDVAASSIRKSEFLVKEDIRSILEIPVVRSGELAGVIAVFSQHMLRQFSQEEVNMAQAFTYHAASAMENARLYNVEREQRIQLEKLDEMRSEFLLAVSHELKTPLTSIKSASELMLDEALNPDDPHSKLLSIIKHNTERMEKRIQELLDFIKMRSSTLSLQRKAEDINHTIEETTAINAPTLWLRKQTLKTKLLYSATMVMLDRYRFDQIMTNLLSNASKYSPQGSEIEVGMRVANSHIIIDVCDRGPGVPQEEKERIFEPYYRGKKATGSGLGLGLAIAKSLVELHGGQIWVSDRDGGGSVFSFSLPIEREQV